MGTGLFPASCGEEVEENGALQMQRPSCTNTAGWGPNWESIQDLHQKDVTGGGKRKTVTSLQEMTKRVITWEEKKGARSRCSSPENAPCIS